MKKLFTYGLMGILILTLTGCNIEKVKYANPNCKAFPVGGSQYLYVLYDIDASLVKLVKVNDNGTISNTIGSITIDEYVNQELTPIQVDLDDGLVIFSPVYWNSSYYTLYISNGRLMCESDSGTTTQILHFAEIVPDRQTTKTSKYKVSSHSVTNYVTITNYVERLAEAYDDIDFNFHK